jgi:hypothetical protein
MKSKLRCLCLLFSQFYSDFGLADRGISKDRGISTDRGISIRQYLKFAAQKRSVVSNKIYRRSECIQLAAHAVSLTNQVMINISLSLCSHCNYSLLLHEHRR